MAKSWVMATLRGSVISARPLASPSLTLTWSSTDLPCMAESGGVMFSGRGLVPPGDMIGRSPSTSIFHPFSPVTYTEVKGWLGELPICTRVNSI